jgi:UDP-N-acetylglucosamine 2-epimerase (non-hydrolysing)
MRTAVVLGTRPEIIKLAPVIRALEKRKSDFFVLHTGQHYSYNMDRVFFENLRLEAPSINLRVGSGTHAEETGRMMIGIEKVLKAEHATGLLVEGDTNSVLAGALTAAKLHLKVGHVEAGLRSWDRRMPEELNRIVADHLSDLLFSPTSQSKSNLLREGIDPAKVFVTGNTIVDSVNQNLQLATRAGQSSIVARLGSKYMLATVHRQENVDDPERLQGILAGLELAAERTEMPVVYPAHPRSRKVIEERGLGKNLHWVRMTPPVDYLQFLKLEKEAQLILTDSGGVQEEACILRVPCVTMRDSTERPETVQVGANTLAGADPKVIVKKALQMLARERRWKNPFGDGKAAQRIVKAWTTAPFK